MEMFDIVLICSISILVASMLYIHYKGGYEKMEKYLDNGEINQQWFSEEIARREGKKEQVNIAQIKEILKIILEISANEFDVSEIETLLAKHRK